MEREPIAFMEDCQTNRQESSYTLTNTKIGFCHTQMTLQSALRSCLVLSNAHQCGSLCLSLSHSRAFPPLCYYHCFGVHTPLNSVVQGPQPHHFQRQACNPNQKESWGQVDWATRLHASRHCRKIMFSTGAGGGKGVSPQLFLTRHLRMRLRHGKQREVAQE